MKILILCTANSCRSQMAEAILKSFDERLLVYSAGTKPCKNVNPYAIKVMQEIGVDISKNVTKNVSDFLTKEFDFVITVCDDANETCPVFSNTKNRLHIGFRDPVSFVGTEDEILHEFRMVRDDIQQKFYNFFVDNIAAEEKERIIKKESEKKKNILLENQCSPNVDNNCNNCSGCSKKTVLI